MLPLLLVGAGGFVGAVARYVVDLRVSELTRGSFPWGTLLVNASGSLLVGLLFALLVERAALPAAWRGPLMIGFIGSYTTFSTLALESWRMIEDGAWLAAGLNLGGTLVLGLAAVMAGIAVGRAI